MRKFIVGRVLMVVAAALLVSGPAFAAPPADYTTTSPLGVMGNVGIPVFGGFQVVGDVGINHKNESGAGLNVGTLAFGGRYVIGIDPSGTVKPFVEGLGGIALLNAPDLGTQKGFTWGVGAGVDVMALRWAGVRLQVNYFHTQLESGGPTLSQIRFGIGLCLGSKVKVAGGWAPARLKASNVNNPV